MPLEAMSAAADAEDKTEKCPVNAGCPTSGQRSPSSAAAHVRRAATSPPRRPKWGRNFDTTSEATIMTTVFDWPLAGFYLRSSDYHKPSAVELAVGEDDKTNRPAHNSFALVRYGVGRPSSA